MFNIGAGEMIFILVAALLILGPQRLPELARGIGKFLREFRRQTDEVRTVVTREFYQMDREFEREPSRPAPVPPPAMPEQAALPPPIQIPSIYGGGDHAHLTPPAEFPPGTEAAAPVEPPAQAEPVATPGAPEAPVSEQLAQALPKDGAVGETSGEREEELPRFAPIPGTVARNAPKQS